MIQKRIPRVMTLLKHVCKIQSAALRDSMRKLLTHPDEEAVHDVRVACRRLRVALRTTQPVFRQPLICAAIGRVRTLMSELGDIRDMEVFCERLAKFAQKKDEPHAAHLADMFHSQMELQRLKIVAQIDRAGFNTLPRLVDALINPMAMRRKKLRKYRLLRAADVAQEVLLQRLAKLEQYDSIGSQEDADALHQLRIQFKKFRYSAEFFEPAFGAPLHGLVKYAKAFQEVLGDLHDAYVAEERLRPWLRRETQPRTLHFPGHAQLDYRLTSAAVNDLVHAVKLDQQRLRRNFFRLWTARKFNTLRRRIEALGQPAQQPLARTAH